MNNPIKIPRISEKWTEHERLVAIHALSSVLYNISPPLSELVYDIAQRINYVSSMSCQFLNNNRSSIMRIELVEVDNDAEQD